jgi:hypothetical protein
MAIVVEDGSIVTGANSYVTVVELQAYASARGVTIDGQAERHLIQAMDYIENLSFKGYKKTDDQPLQWPRMDVYVDGYLVASNVIPDELKNGLMQCAIAIHEGNDPLQDAPRAVQRQKVDVIEVEYAAGASSVVINKRIMHVLKKLLVGGGTGGNVIAVGKA